MRGLALVLLQVFSLLDPALGLLGPSPFSRNALAFGVVPDVNVFKGALSADSPAGNWTVKGGCVAASFNLSLQIPDDPNDETSTMTLKLDPSTKGLDGVNVSLVGNCSTSIQGMALTWRDKDILNVNNTLDRMIAVTFTKNGTGDSATYGITNITGMAEVVVNKTSMYVHFSSSFSNPLMVTNVNNSYTCTTNDPISINSTFSDKKANTEAQNQTDYQAYHQANDKTHHKTHYKTHKAYHQTHNK